MGTIKNLSDKVAKLDLRAQLPDLVQQTSYEIEALNKEQLYRGENAEGYQLFPEYRNKYYARRKRAMNKQPGYGIPDLFLTGAFYKGFNVKVSSNEYEIDSNDSKAEDLKAKYGQKIFGLQKSSKKTYSLGVFHDAVKKYITSITGLIFR